MHNKRLMDTVRIGAPDPRMAHLILEQFGGADGELAAAMRDFTQGLADGDGTAQARLASEEVALEEALLMRTMSDPDSDPTTGAELGETTTTTRTRD